MRPYERVLSWDCTSSASIVVEIINERKEISRSVSSRNPWRVSRERLSSTMIKNLEHQVSDSGRNSSIRVQACACADVSDGGGIVFCEQCLPIGMRLLAR